MGRPSEPSASTTKRQDRTGSVKALLRALALLEILSEDDEGYHLVDLAKRAGLPPSTTHRLLTTLQQRHFVEFHGETGLWHVGVRCFSVGAVFLRRRDLVARALPAMRSLRDDSGETANLGIEDAGELVFLTQIESRQMMRAITRPGGRAPMHCSAMGKALLAFKPETEVAAILQKHGMRRLTPSSIVRPASLMADLRRVRVHRFALDDEEHAVGLRCIAAPIFDERGEAIAALSISGPTGRLPDRQVPHVARRVLQSAEIVTGQIGGRGPSPARRVN